MTQWGLDNLFNPGKRHMDDEKRRLQSTREEVGDNSGGRRIDLEGGKVSISVPRRTTASARDPEDSTDLDAALAAEDVPAVALGNDEAEIEPAVAAGEASDAPENELVAEATPGAPAAAVVPEPGPEPATPTPAAKTRSLSANAWSRRG